MAGSRQDRIARRLVASLTLLDVWVGSLLIAIGVHLAATARGHAAAIAFGSAACWILPIAIVRVLAWRRGKVRAAEPAQQGSVPGG